MKNSKQEQAPILINEYKEQIERTQQEADELIPQLQKVVDNFLRLEIGEITTEQLIPAVTNPKGFFDARINELVTVPEQSVGGFKVKKSSVIQDLELPKPEAYISSAMTISKRLTHLRAGLNLFAIVDNRVIIDSDQMYLAVEASRSYITDPLQIEAYKMIEKIANDMMKLNAFSKENFGGKRLLVPTAEGLNTEFFIIHGLIQEVKPNPSFFHSIKSK